MDSIQDILAKPRLLLSVVIAIVLVGGGIGVWNSQRNATEEKARSAFYLAQKAFEKELKAAAGTPPADAGAEAKKKSPNPPEPTESISFKKLDVDATFPDTVKQIQALVQQHAGTRAAYEAQLQLGGLYLEHANAEKAVPWFEKAVKSAPNPYEKTVALSAQAHALEDLGRHQDALQAYQSALEFGEAQFKGQLLLAMARMHELLKDTAKARSTYDQIITQFPATEFAKAAEAGKSRLD